MLAAEKSKDTFIAPIGIGLVLFIVCMADVNYSGASFNPARSLGPCVAALSFPEYHWIYWIGPMMGASLAAGCYHCIKVSGKPFYLFDFTDSLALVLQL
jgi:aquaporin related protein